MSLCCDEDLYQPFRKINIFNINIDDSSSQRSASLQKQKSQAEHPVITREALTATLDLAMMFPNKDNPKRYSARSSVDKSRKIEKHSHATNHEKRQVNCREDDR